jgi:hypothetical protein
MQTKRIEPGEIDWRVWARQLFPMLNAQPVAVSPRRVRALRRAWIAAAQSLGDNWREKLTEVRREKHVPLYERMKRHARKVAAEAKRAQKLEAERQLKVRPIRKQS